MRDKQLQYNATVPAKTATDVKKSPQNKTHPVPERGVRVRLYPTCEQHGKLTTKFEARQTLWNKICDVFARDYARRTGKPAGRLTIACTRKAIINETLRARTDTHHAWLRPLSRWSCERIVKQAFQARDNAFARHCRHPHATPWRATRPGTWCTYYDGRQSDQHYTPDKALHLVGLGTFKVRTGTGHMPVTMTRHPTVTISRDACARWWASFATLAPGAQRKALVIETLNVRGLARAMLGKSVLDAGLGTLLAQLQYKAQWNAIPITKCPTHYPSSQRCSHCGHQYRELTLSMREWTCPACTTRHDRDTNAGGNIKAYGVSWWTAQGHTILTSRTHRLGGTASGSRPRERPGSAHNVAGTSLARLGTAIRTSNREQVTDELSGTVRP